AGRVPKPAVAAGALITLILAATLSARADVWGDRTRLYLQWAADNPGSARAQLSAANVLQHEGQPEAAREILEEATRRVPDDLALRLQLLRLDTQQGRPISSERLERVEATAARAAFSIEALVALRRLTEEGLDTVPGGIDPARALALWQALGDNPRYTAAPDTIAVAEHYRGWIHAAAGREAQAIARFKSALAHSGAVEMGMMQAAILATHQHYCTAIDHLGRTEPRLSTDHHAARRQDYYRREIARIRRAMRRDAAEAGVRCETE
ncbi:MAG: tetratricopeptide repeat protein, partial [Gammaproteobacteria bacterium]|nr:tetratricopeptide repeat protein [Gammaproteobacteria bacterium]